MNKGRIAHMNSVALAAIMILLIAACQPGPDPKIAGLDFDDTGIIGVGGSSGTEAFVNLECIVRNAGGAGQVEVIGRLEGADTKAFRETRKTVTLEENEEQKVVLNFVLGGNGLIISESETVNTHCEVKAL
jgi:hypothetical protein